MDEKFGRIKNFEKLTEDDSKKLVGGEGDDEGGTSVPGTTVYTWATHGGTGTPGNFDTSQDPGTKEDRIPDPPHEP